MELSQGQGLCGNRWKCSFKRYQWERKNGVDDIRGAAGCTEKKRLWKKVKEKTIPAEYEVDDKKKTNLVRKMKGRFEKRPANANGDNKRHFLYVKKNTKRRKTIGPLKGT